MINVWELNNILPINKNLQHNTHYEKRFFKIKKTINK
jgi:hypothetical protein